MTTLNPYMFFGGNCREAMTFYKDCLGGDLNVQSIGESPMAGQMPTEMHQNVMHSVLKLDGVTLMASDMADLGGAKPSDAVSLMLDYKDEAAMRAAYDKLVVGGQATHPLEATFWGATFGDLVDKFGRHWMFNHDTPK